MAKTANVVGLKPTPIPYDNSKMVAVARIRVTVVGTTPLLTHNPASMNLGGDSAKRGTRVPDPKVEAEAGAYRLEDGTCAMKAEAFIGSMIGKKGAAGAWKGKNRSTMKSHLAHIEAAEDLIPLFYLSGERIKEYIIDQRPVVVQKARIIRARPRYDEWMATFTIIYDPQLVTEPRMIVDILADAGQRVGACDYRPRFGRFVVKEYTLL